MRTQIKNQKSQNKLLFCSLCGFMTEDPEELDHHYRMVHEDYEDEISEIEFEQIRKESRYDAYQRICKSRSCIIRRYIDFEDDKNKIRKLYKDYCLTCDLHSLLFNELKKEGKI